MHACCAPERGTRDVEPRSSAAAPPRAPPHPALLPESHAAAEPRHVAQSVRGRSAPQLSLRCDTPPPVGLAGGSCGRCPFFRSLAHAAVAIPPTLGRLRALTQSADCAQNLRDPTDMLGGVPDQLRRNAAVLAVNEAVPEHSKFPKALNLLVIENP